MALGLWGRKDADHVVVLVRIGGRRLADCERLQRLSDLD